jgi:hypothetical protein
MGFKCKIIHCNIVNVVRFCLLYHKYFLLLSLSNKNTFVTDESSQKRKALIFIHRESLLEDMRKAMKNTRIVCLSRFETGTSQTN